MFAVTRVPAFAPERRREIVAQLLPVARGAASVAGRMVVRYDDSPDVLDFVGADAPAASAVATVGAACPDHLVHTKRTPLFVDWDGADFQSLVSSLQNGVAQYIRDYETYFNAHRGPGDRMGNPAPRVVLIPGLGMITTGKDAALAKCPPTCITAPSPSCAARRRSTALCR